MALPDVPPPGATLGSYFMILPATLLIYDYLLSFERELSLMWRSPWSIIKAVFFVSRYAPFLTVSALLYYIFVPATSPSACRAPVLMLQWVIVLGIAASEAILFMRTWALWNRSTRVAIALGTVYFGAVISTTAFCIFWQDTVIMTVDIDKFQTRRCYAVYESHVHIATFSIIIFEEMFVIGLTVACMARQYHLMTGEILQCQLTGVLYRDGMIFFVYMLLISVINLAILLRASEISSNILVTLQHVFHSILSARVLFHLRETQRQDPSIQSLPDVVFAIPNSGCLVEDSDVNGTSLDQELGKLATDDSFGSARRYHIESGAHGGATCESPVACLEVSRNKHSGESFKAFGV